MAKKEAKALTKTQLITHLAEKAELPKKKIVELLEEILEVAFREAKKDHGFTLPGLGKLVVTKRKARTGRNPQTGEPIKIPAKKALKFRIAKQAKDSVLGAVVKK
ncbi:HU family DNA-binding protein [soil metagenome]